MEEKPEKCLEEFLMCTIKKEGGTSLLVCADQV